MKKLVLLICLAALVLLAIPASGLAAKAGDFDLGGYVKLETFWDSTEMGKNLQTPALRRNAAEPNRVGRLKMTSQSTRFNFTIRGPEVWGAKTVGFIEIDFDAAGDARQSASNAYAPRMRHAWFRMDWPGGWSVLMGQYWGMFCNFYPETIQDGPFQNHGQSTQRIPQIRATYKTGPWTFSGLVGVNYDPAGDNATFRYGDLPGSEAAATNTGSALIGQRSTFPQFQFQAEYEQDLWGKAGFGGRPRGFVANLSGGITSINYPGGRIARLNPNVLNPNIANGLDNPLTWGFNDYDPTGDIIKVNESQTLTPWVIQATLFFPILTTTTANLKNTANISVQFYVGQGLSAFGNGTDADNSYFMYDSPGNRFIQADAAGNGAFTNELRYRRHLTKKYGGYIQGQYYFNNQWYVSYTYGFAKAYGVSQSKNGGLGGPLGLDPGNLEGYRYLTANDQTRMWQEHCATLFYSPIKAFKFGLGYSFVQTDYYQITTIVNRFGAQNVNGGGPWANAQSYRSTRTGQNHSVRFGGWFFF